MKKNYNYFPILKTTDAELKAYENLNQVVKDGILPIFELTKSRFSSKNPTRTINKRIDKIKELIAQNPFILDLTTEPQLTNEEIDNMLQDNTNGYEKWVELIKNIKQENYNIIPVIHYNPFYTNDVELEIRKLTDICPTLAFRVSVFDEDLMSYLEHILSIISPVRLILILDAEFLNISPEGPDKTNIFRHKAMVITEKFPDLKAIMCAFSSFPDAVTKKGYGKDFEGCFPRAEKITREGLKTVLNAPNFFFSDYASIHPKRYYTVGAQWVPRIDFLDDKSMLYYRCRRDDGGYIRAAQNVISDKRYRKINAFDVWGDAEIYTAANGYPNGLAPSHWIAVRANLYMSWQFIELKDENQMLL